MNDLVDSGASISISDAFENHICYILHVHLSRLILDMELNSLEQGREAAH